jgi:hypothetical protein
MKRVAGLDPNIGGVDRAALRHPTTRACTASLFQALCQGHDEQRALMVG